MNRSNNIPLSCTRGMHFFKKVSVCDQCMYCNKLFLNGIMIHQGNELFKNPPRLVAYTGNPRIGKSLADKIAIERAIEMGVSVLSVSSRGSEIKIDNTNIPKGGYKVNFKPPRKIEVADIKFPPNPHFQCEQEEDCKAPRCKCKPKDKDGGVK